jgi:hypothetical protein
MIAYGLTTTAKATSRPAAASRPRRIATSATTTITARSVLIWPSTTSCAKNFSIATSAIVTSSHGGLRASGSSARLSATSATSSPMDIVNHTAFAIGSGTSAAGMARTANAGRYLN